MRNFLAVVALIAVAVVLDSSFNNGVYTGALFEMLSDIALGTRSR
ncbi:MAG TPA: hypothetical protein VFL51_17460 [Pseudolabrys sp.]|nr:hypothetical protein [Pseudolabrys sp.]